MKTLHILIGCPCVGKSTWIESLELGDETSIISHDDAVTQASIENGFSYRDFFKLDRLNKKKVNKRKNEIFGKMITDAKDNDHDIFVDMTNMTKKGREKMKQKIESFDTVQYVLFEDGDDVDFLVEQAKTRDERLDESTKKGISRSIICIMRSNYIKPEEDEYDTLFVVNPWWQTR